MSLGKYRWKEVFIHYIDDKFSKNEMEHLFTLQNTWYIWRIFFIFIIWVGSSIKTYVIKNKEMVCSSIPIAFYIYSNNLLKKPVYYNKLTTILYQTKTNIKLLPNTKLYSIVYQVKFSILRKFWQYTNQIGSWLFLLY